MDNGMNVKGRFGDIMITGRVIASRIISNELMYTIKLDNPIRLRWRPEVVNTVLLSNNEIEVIV
jgi:hypothetical protein